MCFWEGLRGRLRNLPQLASTAVLPVPGRKLSITIGPTTNRGMGDMERQVGSDKGASFRSYGASDSQGVKHGEVRSVMCLWDSRPRIDTLSLNSSLFLFFL